MYTYIIPPTLGRNDVYFMKSLHHMGKILLNMTPSETLAMMKKLPSLTIQ
jgi:hypothetical protein